MAQRRTTMNDWISVKERLPDVGMPVLICGKRHRVTAYYDNVLDAFRLTENENLCYAANCVTHWMPLPEPPKEIEE